jgi:hypothetical protein
MFSSRKLKEEDYDLLVSWWKQWRWTAPPRDFLPQNGTGGVMIEKDGKQVVAGFIYLTNSAVAWSEFIISNFDYKESDRHEAIKFLISELSRIAQDCGAKYVYTVVKNQSLQKLYQEIGYTNGSQKVTEMFLKL